MFQPTTPTVSLAARKLANGNFMLVANESPKAFGFVNNTKAGKFFVTATWNGKEAKFGAETFADALKSVRSFVEVGHVPQPVTRPPMPVNQPIPAENVIPATESEFRSLLANETAGETRMHAVGQALVILNARQTQDERQSQMTKYHNNRGFRPCHARMGTSMARYYNRNGKLSENQVTYWTRPAGKTRTSRLSIYARQVVAAADSAKE